MLKDIHSGKTILSQADQQKHQEAADRYGIDISMPISENQHLQLLAEGWAQAHGEEAVTKLLAAVLDVELESLADPKPASSESSLMLVPGGKQDADTEA